MNAACSKSFCCFTCVRLFEAFARGPLSEGAASSWDVVSPCGASPPHPVQPSCGRRLPCVSLMSALHGRGPLFEGFSTPSGPTVLRTATAVRVSPEVVRSGLRLLDSLSGGAPRVSHEHVRSGLLPLNSLEKRSANQFLAANHFRSM